MEHGKDASLDVSPELIAYYKREVIDLEASDVFIKPTAKELMWVKQHALGLDEKIKDKDYYGTRPIRVQCRIKATSHSLTLGFSGRVRHVL